MRTIYSLSMIILTLIFCRCTNDVAGSNDETSSGTVASLIYNPNGTPSAGAIVKIFKVSDSTKIPVLEKITDQNGYYSLAELAAGTYNGYAENNSLVAFQDSIRVLADTILVRKDTLEAPRSITGIIGLQPHHDPQTATVQVLGTAIYSNVTENGYFTLHKMAQGDFTFKLSTTLANYTTTYKNMTIDINTSDTLTDTLWIIYTGIPVVLGMATCYDTVNGTVKLSWNSTNYNNFQDFLVYKKDSSTIAWPDTASYMTIDTICYDTIFRRSIPGGPFSFTDTNVYHYSYRVCIRNNSDQIGLPYKYVNSIAVSPTRVKTSFSFEHKHLKIGLITDSASINDSIQIVALLSNPTRTIKKVSWAVGHIDSIKQVKIFDPLDIQYSDTLIYLWNSIGNYPIYSIAEDDAGTIWIDTTNCYIVTDTPIPTASTTTPFVSINDSIRLQGTATDVYGTIVKWEWKFGDNAWVITSNGDTTIFFTLTELQVYVCSLRVTDDDENINVDRVAIRVMGTVTDIDGNVYHTIKIGNQVWTVENLRTTKYNDGTVIPNVTDTLEWWNLSTGAYCYYNNDENYKEKYGALYNWYAVNTGKLAPDGWHVPGDAEWTELEEYLIANGYNWDGTTFGNKIAKSMATKTDWLSSDTTGAIGNDLSSNNSSGFSALPGGCRDWEDFVNFGDNGYWWTATGTQATPYYRYLYCHYDYLYRNHSPSASVGLSVRLVRDN